MTIILSGRAAIWESGEREQQEEEQEVHALYTRRPITRVYRQSFGSAGRHFLAECGTWSPGFTDLRVQTLRIVLTKSGWFVVLLLGARPSDGYTEG